MFNSYIGRLVLIYCCALGLIITAGYTYYDDWLDQHVTELETVVVRECDLCSYKTLYDEQGLRALTNALNVRTWETGLDYLLLKNGAPIAGELQLDQSIKARFEQENVASNGLASITDDQAKRLAEDVRAGTYISSIELEENHTLIVEEYLRVNSETSIPVAEQQVFRENIKGITGELALFGAALMVFGFIATTVIAWKIHNKLESINQTADHIIIHQDLGRRIPHSGGNNEFDHLASNLNKMLSKIEGKVEDIKQISNNIAHDLRTPLTSLLNRLEELDSDNPAITDLTSQVNQILETFNALLRISHLESGNAHISVRDVDLETIVGDVIALFAPLAEEKGQKISMELEAQTVKADINLLFQALANLLENAIKYAPGNAHILISSIEDSRQVLIKVQDDGPGIPDDRLTDVIERFVRLDATRSSPGSGLGLSMVRAIAEVHQGALTLNNLRNGFVAIIELPV